MHFEDIWNDAEAIADKTDKHQVEFLVDAKSALDKLQTSLMLPDGQDKLINVGIDIGDVLFALCGITQRLNINSATAMRMAAEKNKAELLDND